MRTVMGAALGLLGNGLRSRGERLVRGMTTGRAEIDEGRVGHAPGRWEHATRGSGGAYSPLATPMTP